MAQRDSWRETAVKLSGQRVAWLATERRGLHIAALRSMDPKDRHDAPVFWRLMAYHGLLGNPEVERKWALILHGMALMTPTTYILAGGETAPMQAQCRWAELYSLAAKPKRGAAVYSEARLNRLLTARGPMLRTLLARLFRMLASSSASFNWREMAWFILNDGYDEDAAEGARHRIAREYYQAARRNTVVQEDDSN